MATRADPLKCQACLEPYKDPFLLPCLHSFCKKCLVAEKEQQGDSEGKLKCPTCKSNFTVPPGGISGLTQNFSLARQAEMSTYECKFASGGKTPCDRCVKQANGFAVVFCCQCCFFLCSSCKENHQSWRQMVSHELVEVGEGKKGGNKLPTILQKPMFCPQHHDEKLKFYCKECEILSCRDCLVYSHKDHTIRPYKEVVDQVSAEIRECLSDCKEVVDKLEGAELEYGKVTTKLKLRKKEVEDEINKVFTALSTAIKDRWEAILNECSTVQENKTLVLHSQIEEFHKLKEAYQYAESALETHESFELLASKKLLKDRLSQCIKSCQQELQGAKEDDVILASLENSMLLESIRDFGSIMGVDTSKSYLDTGIAIAFTTVNTARDFTLLLRDGKSNPVSTRVPITAVLEQVTSGKKTNIAATADEDRVLLSCFPPEEGEYKLSVTVGGWEVKHSPYSMWVKQPKNYSSLSCQKTFSVGRNVNGVTVHSNGDVFISDAGGYVSVFNESGSLKSTIGSPGSGQAQFQNPFGLMIYNDVLYVADQGNHRVQKFTLSGEYIGEFGNHGSGEGQFSGPWGITHDGKGHVIVADYNNRRVQVFDTDGSFIKSIGCGGTPSDVAVDNDGNIHATCYDRHNVEVFSPNGVKVMSYSNSSGSFQNPQGITIDDRGYRFITCHDGGWGGRYYLHILDTNAHQVNSLVCNDYSCGVVLDKNGCIYVAEHSDRQVLKY